MVTQIKKLISRKLRYLYKQYFVERLYGNIFLPFYYNLKFSVKSKEQIDIGNSVLIWNLDSFGDSMWIIPVVKSLKKKFPDVSFTLCLNKAVEKLFSDIDGIRIIPIDPRPFYEVSGIGQVPKELQSLRFDTMIVLEMGSRPADCGRLVGHLINVQNLVSSDLGFLKRTCHYILDKNSDDYPIYWPEYFMQITNAFGYQDDSFQLNMKSEELEEYVVVHPSVAGYGQETKMYPTTKLASLVQHILDTGDDKIIITGGPGEEEIVAGLLSLLNFESQRISDQSGKQTIPELLETISKASLVICNDTSVLHFATAYNKKIMVFFGATNEYKIANIKNKNIKVIANDLECRSCHKNKDGFPYWPKCKYLRAECLWQIDENEVINTYNELMND